MNGTTSYVNKLRGSVSMANTIINGGASPYPKHVGPAAICSFSDGAQDAPLKSLKFSIEPQQDLHGYSYPWPGGGGKNLCDPDGFQNGLPATAIGSSIDTINASTRYCYSNLVDAQDGVAVSVTTNDLTKVKGVLFFGYLNGTLQYYGTADFSDSVKSKTYVFPANTYDFVRISLGSQNASTVVDSTKAVVQMERGTTVTPYAPYSNICPISGWSQVDGKQSGEDMTDYTPITISLGQTVYGGTVDALAGKMTLTHGKVTLNGTQSISLTNWRPTANGVGWIYPYSLTQGIVYTSDQIVPDITSDKLKTINYATAFGATQDNSVSSVAASNGQSIYGLAVRISDTSLTTTAAINAYLAANPIDVVFPLATPIEVDLTPVSGLTSLLGQNNIWASCGNTELDYYPAAASVVAVLNRSSKVYTSIPLGKIRYDTYQTTPNQALDLDSYRAETGVLIRNVLSHTATKIEFNTPSMTNLQWEEVWNIIKAGFNNSTERKLKLKYYDQMSATYKTGWFYVPDVNFTIRNIDEANGIINYDEVRVAFIEY